MLWQLQWEIDNMTDENLIINQENWEERYLNFPNLRGVIKNPDGTCAIVQPSPKSTVQDLDSNGNKLPPRFESLQEIIDKANPNGYPSRIVNVSFIPTDRTFRNVWTDNNPNDAVDVDMPKARGLWMAYIRELRDKKLQELDIEQLKGNDVAAEKQVLRDLPANVNLDAATTPDQLKAIMPDELK
jgi:hypothetical protein